MKQFILQVAWRLTTAVASLVFVLASCNSSDSSREKAMHDPNRPIVLTSFHPDSGRIREMVLLDGDNFGSDPSAVKVFFNSSEAKVIGVTGTRILALVPRLPGDICTLSVQIGNRKQEYEHTFRYKIAASVTTIAGNGTDGHVYDQGLDKSQLIPVYIGADREFNIFITDNNDRLLRINSNENTISVIASSEHGFNHRCQPYVNPLTNVIQLGAEGDGSRDRFMILDPKDGWAPKPKFIKDFDFNGYPNPTGGEQTHYFCLLCEADGNYYTRYNSGLLVRIDPVTWNAKAVGRVPSGIAYGGAMHPVNKNEMWLAYDSNSGIVSNSICKVDVTDETVNPADGMLASFQKLSGATNGAHRDGPLSQAQFNRPRMINFDTDGNLYVGDNGNHCIRVINTSTMMVETIIGIPGQAGFKDGNKDDALFNQVHGIVTDAEGVIYAADLLNYRIRRIAIE